MRYLGTLDPKGAMGLTGIPGAFPRSRCNRRVAVDDKTGKIVWSHRYAGVGGIDVRGDLGLLTTAGKLLFATDPNGDLVRDPLNGKPMRYTKMRSTRLDGTSISRAAGDMVYAFVLNLGFQGKETVIFRSKQASPGEAGKLEASVGATIRLTMFSSPRGSCACRRPFGAMRSTPSESRASRYRQPKGYPGHLWKDTLAEPKTILGGRETGV